MLVPTRGMASQLEMMMYVNGWISSIFGIFPAIKRENYLLHFLLRFICSGSKVHNTHFSHTFRTFQNFPNEFL